jgi:hypothetical protein
MPNLQKKSSLWIMLLTAIITAVIFAPIVWRLAATGNDFQVHMAITANMLTSGEINTPHFLLQVGSILLAPVTGGIFNATVALVLLAEAATALLICRYLLREDGPAWLASSLTLALLLAAPIAILFSLDQHLYLGYIGTNVFHNPTILLLKPLAFASFLYALKALDRQNTCSGWDLFFCCIVTVAGALVKPSFTITILPALGILSLYRLKTREQTNLRLLLFGFFLPAIIILALQYKITYSASQLQGVYNGSSSIILAPLAVMHAYSSWLSAKFILSLAFPLAILFCFFPAARKDIGLQLSWLAFLFGAAFTYLLAESGPRMFHGNFTWSAQITLFILFIFSARLLISKDLVLIHKYRNRFYLCSAILLSHVAFGTLFYVAEYLQTQKYW